MTLEFGFMKHYQEPNLVINLNDYVQKFRFNGNKKDDENKENDNNNNEANDDDKENDSCLLFDEDCQFLLKLEYDVCDTRKWIVTPIQQPTEDEILQKMNNLSLKEKNGDQKQDT